MHWWVLTTLQLNAYSDYTLNRYSHRKDADLGQIMYAVHTCETACLFVPGQAVGRTRCSACDLPRLRCSGNMQVCCPSGVGVHPKVCLPMWWGSTHPPVEQGRCDQLSDCLPLSCTAFSSTSMGGKVCIPRFSKGKVNIKDNASHGQVSSSSEWLFWWMQIKYKKLFFCGKVREMYFLQYPPVWVLKSLS